MAVVRASIGPVGTPDVPVLASELTDFGRVAGAGAGTPAGDAQPWVDAAVDVVQRRCGRILATDMRYPARHDGSRGTIVLPSCAISQVTELIAPDGTDVVGSLGAGDVEFDAAIVWLPRSDRGEWVARVMTATTDERTSALKQAALIIAGHLWGARMTGRSGPGQPGGAPSPAYAVPNRAAEMMAPYVIAGIA